MARNNYSPVQQFRGTTAQHATYTGLPGELTVDTDKHVVVVHDGSTAGGVPMARADHVHPLQTTVSGNAGSATKLAAKRTIDGVSFDGSANIHHYGTCSTAADTAAKTVALANFVLATGAEVTVRFTVTNTASNPTLNVNGTGAKAIQYRNAAISAGYLAANRTYRFVYDGSSYELVGDVDTNTKYTAASAAPKAPGTAAVGTSTKYAREDHVHPAQTIGTASGTVSGTTKLSDATNSTSGADSGVAATPKAVKAAYDKAVEAKNAADAVASSIDPWNIFPMRVPIAVDGVTFGGSDGRRAIMPGETVARENWILCDGGSDGKGGTVPDLRGRMIRGASDSEPAGSTGGSETHSHSISGTVGNTTLTEAQMPSHAHRPSNISTFITEGGNGEAEINASPQYRAYSICKWTATTGESASHTHSLSGTSGKTNSLPPYYAGSFIMRCA